MKKLLILFALLSFTYSNIAGQEIDKPIKISGKFDVAFGISKEYSNIIFLQEKGQVSIPFYGHKVRLDALSTSRLGRSEIVVVTVNAHLDNDFVWKNRENNLSLEVYPVLYGNNYVFYTKDDSLLSPEERKTSAMMWSFWKLPPLSGEVICVKYEIELYNRELDNRLFINQLDNDLEATIGLLTTRFSFENEIYVPDTVYVKRKMSDMALKSLKYNTSNSYYSPHEDIKTKQEWTNWIESLPKPVLEKQDTILNYWQTPWSYAVQRICNGESFLQWEDNGSICAFTSGGGYYLDTSTDTFKKAEGEECHCSNTKFASTKKKKAIDNVELWLKTMGSPSANYIKLSDSDILIAVTQSNGIQRKLCLYKISEKGDKPYKQLFLDYIIPLAQNSVNDIDFGPYAMKMYESHGKYYIIMNKQGKMLWAMLNDGMFKDM